MPWTGATADCPCTWEAVFGGVNCDPQKPGVNKTLAILCFDNLATITETAIDDATPDATGIITDITMATGKQAWTMTNLLNKLNIQSGETVNDNGGVDVNETIDGKGTVTTQELNYVRQYLNKEVIAFFEDNDGKVWSIGHDGGCILKSWVAVWGAAPGDEKSVSYQFLNATNDTVKEVVFATGNEDFFTKLITPAA